MKPTFKDFLMNESEYVEDLLQCEIVYIDEDGNEIIGEAAERDFKRMVKNIKRYYRCTAGPKAGKLVSDPKSCAKRKNPKKVRHGRKVARTRKGIRIRKSEVSARTSVHKRLVQLNKRIRGES